MRRGARANRRDAKRRGWRSQDSTHPEPDLDKVRSNFPGHRTDRHGPRGNAPAQPHATPARRHGRGRPDEWRPSQAIGHARPKPFAAHRCAQAADGDTADVVRAKNRPFATRRIRLRRVFLPKFVTGQVKRPKPAHRVHGAETRNSTGVLPVGRSPRRSRLVPHGFWMGSYSGISRPAAQRAPRMSSFWNISCSHALGSWPRAL